MKINLYSIRDQATNAFMAPFAAHTNGHATRMFSDLANERDHAINKHPNDYELYNVGSIDDHTGKLEPSEPMQIARAADLITKGA